MFGLLLLPETYGPVILKKRAHTLRKKTGNKNIFAPIELEKKGAREILTTILARPFQMFFFEAIVLLTCLYLSLACMYRLLQQDRNSANTLHRRDFLPVFYCISTRLPRYLFNGCRHCWIGIPADRYWRMLCLWNLSLLRCYASESSKTERSLVFY